MEKSMQDMAGQAKAPADPGDTAEKKRIPGWLAGVGAGAFLLAAGVFIYWFLAGSFTGTGDLIPDPGRAERGGGGRGNWRQQANADGVKPLPNNQGHYVLSAGAIMDIDPPPPGKKRDTAYRFRYDSKALLTPEQWHLALGLRRVAQDSQMAKTLDVTQAQLEHLRRFSYIPMELSKADRDRLIAAWTEYDKATAKGEPEKALVAMLKDVGTKSMAATKVQASKRVAEISRVLSPDQVRELTKLGAGEKVTPITPKATAAATKPA